MNADSQKTEVKSEPRDPRLLYVPVVVSLIGGVGVLAWFVVHEAPGNLDGSILDSQTGDVTHLRWKNIAARHARQGTASAAAHGVRA